MNISNATKVVIWAVSCVSIGLFLAAYDGVASPLGIAKTALGAAILIAVILVAAMISRKYRSK